MDHSNNLPFWCLPAAGGAQADGSDGRVAPHHHPPPPSGLQTEMDYYSELLGSLSPVGVGLGLGGQVFTQAAAPCTPAAAGGLGDAACAGGDDEDDGDDDDEITDSLSDGVDKECPSTVAECGGGSSRVMSKGVEGVKEPAKRKKRNRTSEMHSLSERRRRDRIKARLKTLQELLPSSHKLDRASMLDEAIAYIKWLQQQLQMMTRGGLFAPPTFASPAATYRGLCMPQISPYSAMGPNYCMNVGFGVPTSCCATGSTSPLPLPLPLPGISSFPGTALLNPLANWSPVHHFQSSPATSNLHHGASQQFPWAAAAAPAAEPSPVCGEDLQAELLLINSVDQVLTSCEEMKDPVVVGGALLGREVTQVLLLLYFFLIMFAGSPPEFSKDCGGDGPLTATPLTSCRNQTYPDRAPQLLADELMQQ